MTLQEERDVLLERRLGVIEATLGRVDDRLGQLVQQITTQNGRVGRLEKSVSTADQRYAAGEARADERERLRSSDRGFITMLMVAAGVISGIIFGLVQVVMS